MAPSALSPLTARGHPETRLVSVSIHSWLLNEGKILVLSDASYLFTCVTAPFIHSLTHVCFVMCSVCPWLPGVVVMSRVLSSLLPGECVWGESCPWLSWTQMCWTACTPWVVSGTESSSHVICNVKSKRFFFLPQLQTCLSFWEPVWLTGKKNICVTWPNKHTTISLQVMLYTTKKMHYITRFHHMFKM